MTTSNSTAGVLLEVMSDDVNPYFTFALFGSWLLWSFLGILKMLFWIIFFAFFVLWWLQPHLLYMPNMESRSGEKRQVKYNSKGMRVPSEQGLPFEEYFIPTVDGVLLHAWLIPQENRLQCPTIIFFHGNAGNIGFRLPNARQMYHYCSANILMVEYRGYGNSQGTPSEDGLRIDARASLDFLLARDDIDKRKIFLFGRSLGGAVALYLVNQVPEKICGVIVENTFSTLSDMVIVIAMKLNIKWCHDLLRVFLKFFMTSHWHSIAHAKDLTRPILFLSGLIDELVPPEQMQQLYEAVPASSHKVFYPVENGDHNTTFITGGRKYYMAMANFIETSVDLIPSSSSPVSSSSLSVNSRASASRSSSTPTL